MRDYCKLSLITNCKKIRRNKEVNRKLHRQYLVTLTSENEVIDTRCAIIN